MKKLELSLFILMSCLLFFIFYFINNLKTADQELSNNKYMSRAEFNKKFIFKILNKNTKSNYLELNDIKLSINANTNNNNYPNNDSINNINQNLSYKNETKLSNEKCTIKSCFNLTKCDRENFKIYIYNEPSMIASTIYKKIIEIIKKSKYYTTNPNEACLFVPSIDSLDRDKLSVNYLKNMKNLIENLKYWNNGKNHLLFNLYSGSWPNYVDSLELDTNKAILAKASFSIKSYRKNFDISFPLFHADLPFNDSNELPSPYEIDLLYKKKYLLTFKGKRYLNGIGSETRNSVFHLNNNRDILLLTTCKHGVNWQEFKDERCDYDNRLYENYDYNDLLNDSIFCLIPRGRRLATYRFLEALKFGCIPVLLSNSWVIPFSEVLDWNNVVIWADERLLTQIPSTLRDIPIEKIIQMRQNGIFFYNEYFSSVKRIVLTTIEIIKERIFKYDAKKSIIWNTYPGLDYYFDFTNELNDYPFYQRLFIKSNQTNSNCQILFVCDKNNKKQVSFNSINKFLLTLNRLDYLNGLIFIDCVQSMEVFLRNNHSKLIIKNREFNFSNKEKLMEEFANMIRNDLDKTNCVILLKENWLSLISEESLSLGYKTWNENQNKLVGFNSYEFKTSADSFERSFIKLIGIEYCFVHRFFLNHVILNENVWNYCFNLNYSLSDCLFKCFVLSLNLISNKITNGPSFQVDIGRNQIYMNMNRRDYNLTLNDLNNNFENLTQNSNLNYFFYSNFKIVN